jgi:putative ABC transport system permease protein
VSGRLSGRRGGWSLALRLARRDAMRSKGRSLLTLVMIALPVAAVSIADTVYATSDISGVEVVERRIGGAEARVSIQGGGGTVVYQLPDPDDGIAWGGEGRQGDDDTVARDAVDAVLGPRPSITLVEGSVGYDTELGVGRVEVLETELADPLAAGLVELTSGRWPTSTQEVVVNADLLERAPGDVLTLRDGTGLQVVGTAESGTYTDYPRAFALPGTFELGETTGWLVGGDPVTWEQVLELNRIGASVVSRAVLADPPADSELPAEVQWGQSVISGPALTILVLIVVMVLIEVVLLAGPAFAVGARRQARTLALVAAAGGTPAQARRVVLASGVVLGAVAAVVGVLLGLVLAWAVMPGVQHFSGQRFGPYDVVPTHLVAVAAFGLVSAVLAAAVPAWLASRQDVVAVLGGRRGDPRPSRRSPLLGLALMAAGIAGASYGGAQGTSGGGEIPIAVSAVVCVLAMILLVPVVVGVVARLARRLPLPLRFAARDAARHRTRTVPAVAAVAATVAGVVALGIAVTSDEAQNREGYTATLPDDAAAIVDYRRRPDLDAVARRVAEVAPDVTVERVLGIRDSGRRWNEVRVTGPDGGRILMGWSSTLGSSMLVGDAVPAAMTGLDDEQRAAADAVLARGGVVAFSDRALEAEEARVRLIRHDGRERRSTRVEVPAYFVTPESDFPPAQGVLSPAAAEGLGAEVVGAGLYLPGPLSTAEATDIDEAVSGIARSASFYVERGYQTDDETMIAQLVLGGLGAVLMLGGTLTATFLALSDARPDLATLSAVGATPRTRRSVAAAYALVVGFVGAVLGALVGAVPGIAITYPLTGPYDYGAGRALGPSHYLDIPWLLVLGVVVGLPLLTAALVGATARSRLPLTARLD